MTPTHNQNNNNQKNSKNRFLYTINSYHGDFSFNHLAFNANLQEFAQRVAYICSLETSGKISTEVAYNRIENIWDKLKQSKKNLLEKQDFSNEE
ncbi:MAG TPA: hypothetical protein ACFCUY_00090 [Xenococcaceae cyanobacterium]|jgi:hypothetical protein